MTLHPGVIRPEFASAQGCFGKLSNRTGISPVLTRISPMAVGWIRARAGSMMEDMKLTRLFALLVLCTGLIAAGMPAAACCVDNASKHDCCPQERQHAHHGSSGIDAASMGQKCCGTEARTDAAAANAAIERHSDRHSILLDPPLSQTFPAALSAARLPSAIDDPPASSPFPAHRSPLYLRTGRLRL